MSQAEGDDRLQVVATIGMIADLAERIAGDRAEVVALMQPGIDPHLYKPTRDDLAALLAADVVLYNGLKLEGQMTDALERSRSAERAVIAVTQALDPQTLLAYEDYDDANDPHVWMDPGAWSDTLPVILEALVAADSGNEGAYRENAVGLLNEIAALDAYAVEVLGTVPADRRVLVTAHDAFGYFGRRFGFEVLGIQGLSTESEAGVRDIERLVATLVDRQIPAVFVETTVSDKNIQALIAGAAARGHAVTIGGELFSDAMGPAGTYEGTYVGMLDHNVTTIARALGGDAPLGGMQGKLAADER